jgi:ribosomal protein L19E
METVDVMENTSRRWSNGRDDRIICEESRIGNGVRLGSSQGQENAEYHPGKGLESEIRMIRFALRRFKP